MVVSSSSPFQTDDAETQLPAPSSRLSSAAPAETIQASGPTCDLRSRGMGKFPPRLAREPRRRPSLHARVRLPQLPLRSRQQPGGRASASRPIPPLDPTATARVRPNLNSDADDVVTLKMRPARSPVSGVWNRLRFNGFSAMSEQRRNQWQPGRRPRRGRPEGTKGAGSR